MLLSSKSPTAVEEHQPHILLNTHTSCTQHLCYATQLQGPVPAFSAAAVSNSNSNSKRLLPTTTRTMASTNGNAATAAKAGPSNGSGAAVDPRLVRLRAAMSSAAGGKGVAAYIVPTEDPHMSEYPPDTFKRREYISR